MKRPFIVGVTLFLALVLLLIAPLWPQDEILEKMLEPIPDETLKALLTKYPEDAQMHLGAAFLFTDDKNKTEAKDKSIKLAPGYKKIFLIQDLKGVYYKRFAEKDLQRLEELVEIDPGNAWPHYILAGYYLNKREKEKWLREMDEALAKVRLDDYEVECLRAISGVLDEVNPPFKAVNKLNRLLFDVTLPLLSPARNSARELLKIGKEFEEKGEREKALERYKKAERIGQQFLLKKPEFFITRLVSIAIRKMAYKEMARLYEEEGRVIEAAALRKQMDLMDATIEELKEIQFSEKSNELMWPIWRASDPLYGMHWEQIKPEKRQEIKEKMDHLNENIRELLNSSDYVKMVDEYLEKFLSEGEIEACRSLPKPEEFPIAEYLEGIQEESGELVQDILQSLLPSVKRCRDCKSNLKQIGLALLEYANDYQKFYPPPEVGLKALVTKYMWEPILYECPYEYTPRQLKATDSFKIPVAWDKAGNHPGGRNVVFVDSHVEWMPEEEFQKLLAEQKEK